MRINANIKAALDRGFTTRDLGELSGLLGFDAARLPAASLTETIRRATGSCVTVYSRGARGTLVCYEIIAAQQPDSSELARIARALRSHNFAQLQLYLFVPSEFHSVTVATFGLGEHLLTLKLRADRIHGADLEALQDMVPAHDELGSALAARHGRALDRTRVTQRFFDDFAAQRDRVAAAWSGLAARARRDREQLALLLLSRLMFLYFLQHRGYLAGDDCYLARRFRTWKRRITFYRGALYPLFFCVLNRRPERRPARACGFGDLPYLNGGLFERHAIERKHRHVDLDDATLQSVFDDLLERYRFTAPETSDAQLEGVHDVGVDPEMLGRVFEGLMAAGVRATTGTFYTPAATVDRLVCNALVARLEPRTGAEAATALMGGAGAASLDRYQRAQTSSFLRETRILDPACGSGAFLLGGLARLARARALVDDIDEFSARREVVADNLFGVDLQSDAALLCALRLWLALVPGDDQRRVEPLPNLDRQIRQGDSLIDPFDLRAAASSVAVRQCMRELQPAARAYVMSEPEHRTRIRKTLLRAERRLARAWIDTHQQRIDYETAELAALSRERDLFGDATTEARVASSALRCSRQRSAELKRLANDIDRKGERPFFSFRVHFPEAAAHGFDVVLCNPPWVRSHNWPRTLGALARQRFEVCRSRVWQPPNDASPARAGGKQIDLAILFLERCIDLLAPGGVLGILLPAKFMRSLSGASARKLLLERMDVVSIEDHSLDQRSIFAADAFASLIVARKRTRDQSSSPRPIDVTCVKRGAQPMRFSLPQSELPLFAGDTRAPWLLVPRAVRQSLMRMQQAPMLSSHKDLRIRRGVVTGHNHVMVLMHAADKLGGLKEIRSEGYETAALPRDFEGIVEADAVRPLLRGAGVTAWSFARSAYLLCKPANARANFPRLARYLAQHNLDITHAPAVSASSAMLAWHDLAGTLKAVVVPAGVVALNTVYFIPADESHAHLLCAYFNSLPVRTFARAIAERAKDAHFRFFAWTVSLLPLPANWRSHEADRIRALSRAAHADGSLDRDGQAELDALIARAYRLTRADVRALTDFDEWLWRA